MILVILEHVDEAEYFFDRYYIAPENIKDYIFLALTISVQAYLHKKCIHYYSTIDYFSNESHKKCLLKSNEIVDYLENQLMPFGSDFKTENLKDWYIFLIRHINNYLLLRIEVFSNIIHKHKPERILVASKFNCDTFSPKITTKDRVNDYLLNQLHDKVESLGFYSTNVSNDTAKKHVTESKNKERNFKLDFEKITKKYSNKKTLLVLSLSYNLDRIVGKIKKWDRTIKCILVSDNKISFLESIYYKIVKGVDQVLSLDDFKTPDSHDSFEIIYEYCKITEEASGIFEHCGVKFHDIIRMKMNEGILQDCKILFIQSRKLGEILKALKPDLSLSISSRNMTYALGELCLNYGLNALCVSHGTVVPPKNPIEEIVNRNIGKSVILNKYPAVAVQTPWAEKFLDHYGSISKKVLTGPLVFNHETSKRKNKTVTTILHAVTLKNRSSVKFWGVETHDEFVSSLSDLISIVDSLGNTRLRIKLHPIYKTCFRLEELMELLPASVAYTFNTKSLEEELALANVLVSFSSTAIEEALLNRIPVILYDKWNRYQHMDSQILSEKSFSSSTVYYINSKTVLNKQMANIISVNYAKEMQENSWQYHTYPNKIRDNFYDYLLSCYGSKGRAS